ncbi:MAG: DUF4908 domain-containing protein, partial [Pseudomonadota bacterium]
MTNLRRGRGAIAVLAAAALFAALDGPASARDPFDTLRSNWGAPSAAPRREAAPEVAHYVDAEGGRGFVLDLSGQQPLLKFDGSQEIFVLSAVPGPRNDIIYKLDNGATVLRRTSAGGVTLFLPEARGGAPMALKRDEPKPLTAPPTTPAMLKVLADASTFRIFAASGADVRFDYTSFGQPRTGRERAATADAMRVAAQALETFAADPDQASLLAEQVRSVAFVEAEGPAVKVEGDSVVILLNPDMGPAGRPSSGAVVAVVGLGV